MTVGERLAYYRENKKLSLGELSNLTNVPKTNLQRYEKGTTKKIPIDVIPVLEKALSLRPGTLMGWVKDPQLDGGDFSQHNYFMRPVFNSTNSAFGIEECENIEEYSPAFIGDPAERERYVWIKIHGDSMAPLIDGGSEVLVKKQDTLENGQIGVAVIDGEKAVIKKINLGNERIELVSVNPYYPPLSFEKQDMKRVKIVGAVKKICKNL